MKKFVASVFLIVVSFSLTAQTKLAYYNADSLLRLWPEYQKVLDTMVDAYTNHQRHLTTIEADYAIKEMKLAEDSASLKSEEYAARKQEMVDLDSAYARYVRYAKAEVEKLQQPMVSRLMTILTSAAKKAATAKGIELVEEKLDALDMAAVASVNYQLVDITPEVMAELGIPVKSKKKKKRKN